MMAEIHQEPVLVSLFVATTDKQALGNGTGKLTVTVPLELVAAFPNCMKQLAAVPFRF